MRLRLPADPDAPLEVAHLSAPAPAPTPGALAVYEAHRIALIQYRTRRAKIVDRGLRRVAALESPGRALARFARFLVAQIGRGRTAGDKMRLYDVRPLMEHQFEETLIYLQAVVDLLALEPDAALRARAAPVRLDLAAALESARAHRALWRAEVTPEEGRLDLFRFPCGDAPNCVEAIQLRLRDVPWGTQAYQYMQLLAVEAARIEACTGPDIGLDINCEDIYGWGE